MSDNFQASDKLFNAVCGALEEFLDDCWPITCRRVGGPILDDPIHDRMSALRTAIFDADGYIAHGLMLLVQAATSAPVYVTSGSCPDLDAGRWCAGMDWGVRTEDA